MEVATMRTVSRKKRSTEDRPRRAIGYIRVSDRGGRAGPEYHTLDIQRQSIERVCEFRGYELLDTYTEENKSGKDATRPLFQEAMTRIVDDHEADALAVWKVSRFSRSWTQAARDTERLLERKPNPADLLSGEEGFDTATIGGKMLMRILFVVAAWEHDVLSEQWEGIKARSIERGSHLGRNPFGYVRVAMEPTKPYHVSMDLASELLDQWAAHHQIAHDFEPVPGLLVPHPDHALLVGQAFAMRAEQASYADICRFLDANAPLPSGGYWPHTNVRRMLTLRTYLGEVTQQGDEIDLINRSAHLPLVSRDVWRAVQTIEKGIVRRSTSPTQTFPLSGKVYCAGCSWRMGGGTIPQARRVWADTGEPVGPGRRTDRHARSEVRDEKVKVRVYRCAGKRGTGRCSAPSVILADALEELVYRQTDPVIRASAVDADHADDDSDSDLTARISAADDALAEMASVAVRQEMGEDWLPMVRQLRHEKAELLKRAEERRAPPPAQASTVDRDSLTEEQHLRRVREMVGAVFVRRMPRGARPEDRVRVLFQTDELPSLGGPRNRIPPTPYRP
jgi:DNA invertase Pin-like site-specific DNA recombinase